MLVGSFLIFRFHPCDTLTSPPLPAFPALTQSPPAFARSTVEGATLGLTKILGGCWALTYLALVVGNPKFQTMDDPSLLVFRGTPVSTIAVSGGGGGGDKNAGFHQKTGSHAVNGGFVGLRGRMDTDCDNEAATAVPGVFAEGVSAAATVEGGRGLGVIRTIRRWAERRDRRRRDCRRRRSRRRSRDRAGVCGDELEICGGGVKVAVPALVRAGK